MKKVRFKVGITVIASSDVNGALWNNGIGQNIVFLALLFLRLDIVDFVCLVSCPGGNTHPLGTAFGLPVMSIDDAAGELDVIIELGARAAGPEHMDRLHARGGKLVSYVAGNVMVMNFEELARERPFGDTVPPFEFDAVWVTPQHWHTCESYLKFTRSEKTSLVPHIWDPICVNQAAYLAQRNPFWKTPDSPGWSLGCFDPNVNVVKTFHLPLLITDMAYRKRPDLISRILLFSADHMKSSAHVNDLIACLDIGRDKKVFVESRHRLIDVLGPEINAVVAHQWQNNLNYLYWEILYFGWPLVHNSTEFSEVGYYYPEFQTEPGGEAVIEALSSHAEVKARQAEAVRETLWRFSIENTNVRSRHTDLLEELMS